MGLGDTGGVRAGLAPYTDDSDVDRLLEGVAEAATAASTSAPGEPRRPRHRRLARHRRGGRARPSRPPATGSPCTGAARARRAEQVLAGAARRRARARAGRPRRRRPGARGRRRRGASGSAASTSWSTTPASSRRTRRSRRRTRTGRRPGPARSSVNLLGAAHATFCAVPHLVAAGGGAVVNVSSRGAFRGEPDCPAYGASKAGLERVQPVDGRRAGTAGHQRERGRAGVRRDRDGPRGARRAGRRRRARRSRRSGGWPGPRRSPTRCSGSRAPAPGSPAARSSTSTARRYLR